DLTHLLVGMVMPFWAVIGSFFGVLFTFVLNPILYHQGVLVGWREGDDTIITLFKNDVDFYLSFSIGLSLAIAAIGIWSVIVSVRRAKAERRASEDVLGPPPGRGDIPNWLVFGFYLFSSLLYI